MSPIGRIGVGVGAIVTNARRQILLGKRKGALGAGTWQFPGGHLEFQEDVLDCASRETAEEAGVKVKGAKILAATNDVFKVEGKHYVTLFVKCEMENPDEEPRLMEPDKCEGWHWKTWNELRDMKDDGEKMFLPLATLLEQHSLEELQK